VIKSFFAQHQLEALLLDNEILQELAQEGSKKTETELRSVLGCFLFTNEDVFKKIKVLSGGEKSRVALAKTLISEANFLLLDEPTNHLDMLSVNILIQALQQYEGTFVTVSHDRHFIHGVANKIWYIEDHQIKEYPGTYEEYEYWRQQQTERPSANKVPEKKEEKSPNRPKRDKEKDQLKKEIKSLEKNLAELEEKITHIEKKKLSLEKDLANPELYSDEAKHQKITKNYNSIMEEEKQLQQKWERLMEEIETLQEQN
jgi:ATP-binding cassette subfamily F protein 3